MAVADYKMSLKYLSLLILIIQNTGLVLFMRYSRTMPGPRYLPSTAVTMSELTKFTTCMLIVFYQNSWSPKATLSELHEEIIVKYFNTMKTSVPAVLYTIQNNLLFLALSNLDAATFQVTYQMKILTTALFSVVLLQKKMSMLQWVSLGILAVAVALVQWPTSTPSASPHSITNSMKLVGLVAVTLACFSSGFSGVYFEKMLKQSNTSIWIRNIQLGFLSIIIALVGVVVKDWEAVSKDGFFAGYNYIVVTTILLQALGGLVVATVIKYADNILKGFASAISILTSSIIAFFVMDDFNPTLLFMIGTVLVIVSIILYGSQPAAPPLVNIKNDPSPSKS